MGSARRALAPRRLGWLLVLAGVVSAALSFIAPRAQADGATAVWKGPGDGTNVIGTFAGEEHAFPASVMELEIGSATYVAYCIDLATSTPAIGTTYEEVAWSEANVGSDLPRINWILHNGYPNRTVEELRAVAGDGLTRGSAAAATQAAIWHFSDGFVLEPSKNDPAIVALYAHLIDPSVNVGLTAQPPVSISLSPEDASGKAGELIGPFVVSTTASQLAVSTDLGLGEVIVDADGAPRTSAGNGDELFVRVPAGTPAGQLTVTATGMATVQTGRVFVVPAQPAQKFILASAASTPALDTAVASWDTASPGFPLASARPSCVDGGVVVNLRNTGGSPITMRVTSADGFDRPVELAAGATADVVVPVATGGSYDITVSDGGSFFQQFTGTFSCEGFDAAFTESCVDGGVRVLLTTPATEDGSFVVTGPDGFRRQVAVVAGTTEAVVVPVANGQTYEITVTAGSFSETTTGTLQCGKVTASVDPSCARGGIVVTLTSTKAWESTSVVNGPGIAPITVLVPANGTAEVLVPLAEGTAYRITVDVPFGPQQVFEGVMSCDGLDAVASPACDAGGVAVTLTAGDEDATYDVAGPDGFRREVVVAAGGTERVVVPVADRQSYEITVTGGSLRRTFTGTLDCGTVTVTAAERCVVGGVAVTLVNTTLADRQVTVAPAGAATQTVTVPAGATREVVVAVAEGASYEITVTPAGQTPTVLTGTLSCADVASTVAVDPRCEAGGVVVTLRNPGTEGIRYRVLVPGADAREVDVAAGASQTVLVPVGADQPYDVTVTSGSFQRRYTGTLSCAQLAATAAPDCAAGGQVVTLTNAGTTPAVFKVDPGTDAREVTVAAGGSQQVTVPVADGKPFSIAVGSGSFLKVLSGTQSCAVPAPVCTATASERPDLGGVLISLSNTGTVPARFLVVAAPGVSQAVDVPAAGTQDVLVRLTPGSSYSINVTCGAFAKNFAGRMPGDTVMGNTTQPGGGGGAMPTAPLPGQLPRTGSGTGPLLVLAALFVGVGAVLLVIQDVSRPRRRPVPVR
jgi:TQXA domain-containing protein